MPESANRELLNEVDRRQAWFPARKTRPIWAKEIERSLTVETLEGTEKAEAGDYLCRGEAGDVWPQKAERLNAKYAPTDSVDDEGWRRYEPRPDAEGVLAAAIDHPFAVQSPRGRLEGKAGDFLVKNLRDRDEACPDDVWIVDGDLFRATYEPITAS